MAFQCQVEDILFILDNTSDKKPGEHEVYFRTLQELVENIRLTFPVIEPLAFDFPRFDELRAQINARLQHNEQLRGTEDVSTLTMLGNKFRVDDALILAAMGSSIDNCELLKNWKFGNRRMLVNILTELKADAVFYPNILTLFSFVIVIVTLFHK